LLDLFFHTEYGGDASFRNFGCLSTDVFSEMSVDFSTEYTALGYIPEYRTLHNHRCENLKSYDLSIYIPTVHSGRRNS
jgi:hypothetical protein